MLLVAVMTPVGTAPNPGGPPEYFHAAHMGDDHGRGYYVKSPYRGNDQPPTTHAAGHPL